MVCVNATDGSPGSKSPGMGAVLIRSVVHSTTLVIPALSASKSSASGTPSPSLSSPHDILQSSIQSTLVGIGHVPLIPVVNKPQTSTVPAMYVSRLVPRPSVLASSESAHPSPSLSKSK